MAHPAYCLVFLLTVLAISLARRAFSSSKPKNLPPSPTGLPIIGHMHLIGSSPHRALYALAKRYGDILSLRFGSLPYVVVSSPAAAREFLRTHELAFASRPQGAMAAQYLGYGGHGFAFSPYGPYWKFMRKLCMSELLSGRSLANFLPIKRHEIRRFLSLLSDAAVDGREMNVGEEMKLLVGNVLSRMSMSRECSSSEKEAAEIRQLVDQVSELLMEFYVGDYISLLRHVDLQGMGKRLKSTHSRFDEIMEEIMRDHETKKQKKEEERRSGGGEVKDLMDMLLEISEDDSADMKLTRNQIKAFIRTPRGHVHAFGLPNIMKATFLDEVKTDGNVATGNFYVSYSYPSDMIGPFIYRAVFPSYRLLVLDVFVAGVATTALGMEWALAELVNNPRVLQKAREEIESVVGKHRLVEESDIPNLPYVQAVIKETLRLHPTDPIIMRESIQDCNVGGYHIPSKTGVFINVWAVGRDPSYWDKPLEFLPERFIDEKGRSQIDLRGQHYHFLPFGSGRRGCPGTTLALQMIETTIAGIVQCFDMKVNGNGGKVDLSEKPGMTLYLAQPLCCVPVARLHPLPPLPEL
ncbi:hypothetical protein ACLOJK_020286 [Asimina triloba]